MEEIFFESQQKFNRKTKIIQVFPIFFFSDCRDVYLYNGKIMFYIPT